VRFALLLCCAVFVRAQGTSPKSAPDEYEVHASTGTVEVWAEFMVHSVLADDQQSTVVKDYLVVELALFPSRSVTLNVDHGAFTVRLNGKLMPQTTAQTVAMSMQYPEWVGMPRAGGSVGPNIPGRRGPMPRPPTGEQRNGIDPPERLTPAQLVERAALPEGEFKGAVSGYLYFPFKGKTPSIHSLELIYDDTVIKLR
jgi:hypothetical protein